MGLKNEGDCVPGVGAHSGEGASQKLSTGHALGSSAMGLKR